MKEKQKLTDKQIEKMQKHYMYVRKQLAVYKKMVDKNSERRMEAFAELRAEQRINDELKEILFSVSIADKYKLNMFMNWAKTILYNNEMLKAELNMAKLKQRIITAQEFGQYAVSLDFMAGEGKQLSDCLGFFSKN